MLGSILVFIIVLSILVLVHELGHFITAKRAGIWVEEFGFGLPPRIFGKKIRGTIYSINLFPFGGFVRMHGEDYEESLAKPEKSFIKKSKKVRCAIVIAGVVMNFILAIVSFMVVYIFTGIPRPSGNVKILDVMASSPAQVAGIIAGDIVKRVDTKTVTSSDNFISLVDSRKGKRIVLEIERELGGEKTNKKITLTPRVAPPKDEGPLGVVVTSSEIYFPPVWERPFYGIYYGFKDALFWGKTIIVGLYSMIAGLFRGVLPREVSGPVGIFAITSEAYKVGILALINFIGILSVNLAILNIIPFPALDGGRLLFIGIETVFGRKVLPKVEATIHTIGMIILLLLLLAITASDIKKLISAGSISGFLDSFTK